MRSKQLLAIGAGCICASGAAYATQTVTYAYDALGRLTHSQITTGPGSGTAQVFQYDNAGNRQEYTVSGVTGQTPVTLSMASSIVNVTTTGATLAVNVSNAFAYRYGDIHRERGVPRLHVGVGRAGQRHPTGTSPRRRAPTRSIPRTTNTTAMTRTAIVRALGSGTGNRSITTLTP